MRNMPLCLLFAATIATAARAETVYIRSTGTVQLVSIAEGPLSTIQVGDTAVMRMTVDSDVFEDGLLSSRGYPIDEGSFSIAFDGVEVGLQDPFPAGDIPYFVIVNDIILDGFRTSTDLDVLHALPLDEGGDAPFLNSWGPTWFEDVVPSLDIVEDVGVYSGPGAGWTFLENINTPLVMTIDETEIGTSPFGCREDLDGSGAVDFGDILAILGAWGNAGGAEDLDASGEVDFGDLLAVLGAWGPC